MVPSPCNSGGHGGALNVFSVSDSSQNRERQRFPAPAVAAAAATAAEGGTSRGLLLGLPARQSRRWRRNAWESHVSGRAQVWAPTWRSWLGGAVVTRWHGNNTHLLVFSLQGPSLIFLLFDNSKKPDLSAPSIISSRQPVCFPNKIRSRILEVHNFHSLSPESHKRITPLTATHPRNSSFSSFQRNPLQYLSCAPSPPVFPATSESPYSKSSARSVAIKAAERPASGNSADSGINRSPFFALAAWPGQPRPFLRPGSSSGQ